jgi:hypothetical protein
MKLYLTTLSLLLAACAISQLRAPAVDWKAMDEESPIMKRVPGGAVVAAAAAMQAVIERHGVNEFAGCRHAVDGLDVTVLPAKEATGEVFFVIVSQHFSACGDPNDERAPHWDEAYAVTADGRILERAQRHDAMAPAGPADGGGGEADGGRSRDSDGPAPESLDGGAADGGGLSRYPR